MSAWDDPITHIRELEGKVSRVKALMREWEACDEHGNPLREGSLGEAADDLRAALEGR